MNHGLRAVAAICLLGIGGALGWIAAFRAPAVEPSAGPAVPEGLPPGLEFRIEELSGRIEDLTSRLESLERTLPLAAQVPARSSDSSLRRDVQVLAERVGELERATKKKVEAAPAATVPLHNSTGIRTSLREIELSKPAEDKKALREKIKLRERLLRDSPDDEEAGRFLEELVADCIKAREFGKAWAALQRYMHLLPAWRQQRLTGALFFATGQYDEARKVFQALQGLEEIPEWAKAEAMVQYASTFLQQGDAANAKYFFQQMIDHYGQTPPPGVIDYLVEAKTQLK